MIFLQLLLYFDLCVQKISSYILAVTVRDLFYNQPVRRNFIQSSPQKVLQSVKKCVLRVALVHSKVSFKVTDIDSEKELLSVQPSSAISILMSDHGIDEFSSLHKVNHTDGFLSLSGYMTGPSDKFSAKAFQYVYINSRFVFRGPIHKLLNHLVMTFESLEQQSDYVSQKGKRSRSQASLAYIVNLSCPSDLYDLTFETSETYVEFKDWGPILTFIQNAIQQVWSRITNGESSCHGVDLLDNSEYWKGKDDISFGNEDSTENSVVAIDKFQRQQYDLDYSPLPNRKKHLGGTFKKNYDKATCLEFEMDASQFNEQQSEMGFDFPASLSSIDFPNDDLEYRHNTRRKHSGDMGGSHLSSDWKNESPKIESAKMELSSDHEEWINQLEVRQSGYGCRDHEATFQEFEVHASVFKGQQVERRAVCQRGFSMEPMVDVPDCEKIPNAGQEYATKIFVSNHNSEFSDDRLTSGKNCSDYMEGNPFTYWQNESLKNESAKIALSSDHEVWSKKLEGNESGKYHFLHGCSSMRSFSCSKGVLNSEEEPEFSLGEPQSQRRRLCSDENMGVLEVESSNQRGDIFLGNGGQSSVESGKDHLLHGCSSLRSLSCSKGFLNCGEEPEFPLGEPRFKRKQLCSDENIGVLKVERSNQGGDIFLGPEVQSFADSGEGHFLHGCSSLRSLSCSKGFLIREEELEFPLAEPQFKSRRLRADENVGELKVESRKQKDNILLRQGEQAFAESIGLHSDFILHNRGLPAPDKWFISNSDSETSDAFLQPSWNVESFPRDIKDEVGVKCRNVSRDKGGWLQFDLHSEGQPSNDKYEVERDITDEVGVRCGTVKDTRLLSLQRNHLSRDRAGWLQFDLHSEGQNSHDKYNDEREKLGYQGGKNDLQGHHCSRSCSPPPSVKQKRKCVPLNSSFAAGRKPRTELAYIDGRNEIMDFAPNSGEELISTTRPEMKYRKSVVPDVEVLEGKQVEHGCLEVHNSPGFMTNGSRKLEDFVTKWRNSSKEKNMKTGCDGGSYHSSILDISSGFFSLAGRELIPESLQKNCLRKAKVLHQLDKKFIPVVAGGTLCVIDQHAADERIRLEELRDKVLSGKARTISYLDPEEELILPEFGYQLLHDYAGQVREWGWICNMQAQGSGMFNKNLNVLHQHTAVVTLIAVPCILGTNLSGGDLLEFLQQLADTDGASTIPPCVGRVLNSKACRGAIMFGDSLLQSECALIVEELEKTRLCFQCAHGRPTTAPLVNLAGLHGEITKVLALTKKNDTFILQRQELSISRATQRLAAGRGAA
ncbi:unnamed protein product [Linum tenue]|uniref:DNA mismatch repair protein MLH3 n=1 Tax=Linum tenue TaxID=586396 RepID=A0AAV0KJ73_9ROSI|nr:unnamed protein product [Linum tenue]